MKMFHRTGLIFQCETCTQKFDSIIDMENHIKATHITENSPQLLIPVLLHFCHLCEMSFQSFTALETHIEANHPPIKSWHCYSCTQMFDGKQVLDNHMQHVHTMQPFLHFYDGFKNMPENRKQNVSSYTNAPIAQLDGVHDTCSESDFTFDANDEEVFPSIGNRPYLFESLPNRKSSPFSVFHRR